MPCIYKKYINQILIIAIALVFTACKNDMQVVNSLTEEENTPGIVAKNSEVIYTENGIVKLKVMAPTTKRFQFAEEPHTEFPDGITVFTYDDKNEEESNLTAKFAIYYEKKELWMVRNNVVAKNRKGEILNTEELFWDEKKKTIYSNVMVKITTKDGVTYGQGFESDERFEEWIIKRPTGEYNIDE